MNIKKIMFFTLMAAALCAFTPVYAQTATFDSVTSTETAAPGAVVTVDLVISYDCDSLTTFSPGVYDLMAESYLVEDGFEVTGTGTESISLAFNAPTIEGEYVYVVDMYYQNGTDWYYTGQDNYYISLTVGEGVVSNLIWSAIVSDVNAPGIVKPGASFDVKVTIDYVFPKETNMEVAVTDPETGDAIDVVSTVKDGTGSDEFTISIIAPDQEGTYLLGADAVYETDIGWEFTDNAVMTFSIEVDSNASGGGIPGFPVMSVLMGALVMVALMQYNGRKTPLF